MQKRFIVILVLVTLLFLITSVYASTDLPPVPEVGPGRCVEMPGYPCHTSTASSEETPAVTEEIEETPEEVPEEEPVEEKCYNYDENLACKDKCDEAYTCMRWGCTDQNLEDAQKAAWYACLEGCKLEEVPCEEGGGEKYDEEEVPEEITTEDESEEVDKVPLKEDQTKPESEDSAALMEVVAAAGKKHEEELSSIQNYYARPSLFPGMTQNEEGAKREFDKTVSFGVELVNAKWDYLDALKKGDVSEAELAKLRGSYETKMQQMKNKLQNNVLSEDSGNAEALWQLGTLYKWEGNNRQSYEYYRDALVQAKARNPFKYQQLLDSINNPGIRMELLQSMEPNEKIITLPTAETSPMLKWLKDNLKTLVKPVDDKMKETAETIEKISRAFSSSNKIDQTKKDLGISPLGAENE